MHTNKQKIAISRFYAPGVNHSNSKEVFAYYTRGTDYNNNKLTDMDINYQTLDDDWNPEPYNIDDSVQWSGDVTYRAFGTPRFVYKHPADVLNTNSEEISFYRPEIAKITTNKENKTDVFITSRVSFNEPVKKIMIIQVDP